MEETYYCIADIHNIHEVAKDYCTIKGIDVVFTETKSIKYRHDRCFQVSNSKLYEEMNGIDGIVTDDDIWEWVAEQAVNDGYKVSTSANDDDLMEAFGEEVPLIIYGKEIEGDWLSLLTIYMIED
jgi:hypothetical protein